MDTLATQLSRVCLSGASSKTPLIASLPLRSAFFRKSNHQDFFPPRFPYLPPLSFPSLGRHVSPVRPTCCSSCSSCAKLCCVSTCALDEDALVDDGVASRVFFGGGGISSDVGSDIFNNFIGDGTMSGHCIFGGLLMGGGLNAGAVCIALFFVGNIL